MIIFVQIWQDLPKSKSIGIFLLKKHHPMISVFFLTVHDKDNYKKLVDHIFVLAFLSLSSADNILWHFKVYTSIILTCIVLSIKILTKEQVQYIYNNLQINILTAISTTKCVALTTDDTLAHDEPRLNDLFFSSSSNFSQSTSSPDAVSLRRSDEVRPTPWMLRWMHTDSVSG